MLLVSVLMITDSLGVLALETQNSGSAAISKEMVARVKRESPEAAGKATPGTATTDALPEGEQCGAEATSCGLDDAEFLPVETEISFADLMKGPVVLDFFKPDCPACLKMVPVMESLRSTCASRGLRVEKINISDPVNMRLARELGVRGTPTFLFVDEQAVEVARLVGVQETVAVQQAMAVLMGKACADFSPLVGGALGTP